MSPLLEDVSLESAKAVLYNITAPMDITAEEIAEIGDIIADATPEDANIIFGVVFDDNIGDEIRLTVIATGIESPQAMQPVQAPAATVTNFRQPGPDAVMAEPRRRQLGRSQQGNLVQESQEEPEMRLPHPPFGSGALVRRKEQSSSLSAQARSHGPEPPSAAQPRSGRLHL